MPPLDRQMNTYERSKWLLWVLSLLTQSLFLVAMQIDTNSAVVWAAGSSALVFVLLLIALACFEEPETAARRFWNIVLVGGVPSMGLTLLYWNDVTLTVPAAAFEALCSGLMACWVIFDFAVLKPASITVRFDDVVADAVRNAGMG